jgi:hypothetical protein
MSRQTKAADVAAKAFELWKESRSEHGDDAGTDLAQRCIERSPLPTWFPESSWRVVELHAAASGTTCRGVVVTEEDDPNTFYLHLAEHVDDVEVRAVARRRDSVDATQWFGIRVREPADVGRWLAACDMALGRDERQRQRDRERRATEAAQVVDGIVTASPRRT